MGLANQRLRGMHIGKPFRNIASILAGDPVRVDPTGSFERSICEGEGPLIVAGVLFFEPSTGYQNFLEVLSAGG